MKRIKIVIDKELRRARVDCTLRRYYLNYINGDGDDWDELLTEWDSLVRFSSGTIIATLSESVHDYERSRK